MLFSEYSWVLCAKCQQQIIQVLPVLRETKWEHLLFVNIKCIHITISGRDIHSVVISCISDFDSLKLKRLKSRVAKDMN